MPSESAWILETQPPEMQFLVLCLHRQLTPAQKHKAHALAQGGIDGQKLYDLAMDSDLPMLLYRGLLQLQPLPALADLLARLESVFTSNAIYYEFVYPQQLKQIAAACASAGAETLLLKGYILGQTIYEQPALRPYGDFDILVHEADLDTAEQQLVALGYYADESQHPRGWYRQHHHHLAPYLHNEWLPVEVHWDLSYNLYRTAVHVSLDEVWAQSQVVRIDEVEARTLCPEHNLIYMCIHAVNIHLFSMGLKPLCDVAELLSQYSAQLDWEAVISASQRWGCARHVCLMLSLVSGIFEVELPPAVLDRLVQGGFDPDYVDYSIASILSDVEVEWGLGLIMQQVGLRRKWFAVSRRFFPTRERVARRYGQRADSPLVWLYYPVWYGGLIQRFTGSLWRLMRNRQTAAAFSHHESTRARLLNWLGEK